MLFWMRLRFASFWQKMYDPPCLCKVLLVVTAQSAQMYPASRKWAAVAARP
jgi:hypothetical protein